MYAQIYIKYYVFFNIERMVILSLLFVYDGDLLYLKFTIIYTDVLIIYSI